MYGTIARMRPKPGHEQQLQEMMDQWRTERRPKVKGVVTGYLLRPDQANGEVVVVAVFQDRASYRANADDPEQDRWYRQLREHLEADPIWLDGEITQTD